MTNELLVVAAFLVLIAIVAYEVSRAVAQRQMWERDEHERGDQ